MAAVRSLPRSERAATLPPGAAPALLLLAGGLGVLAGPLTLAWREGGWLAVLNLAGLGPLDVAAWWAVGEAICRAARAGQLRADPRASWGFALLLLLPSGSVAAAGLVAYGAVTAFASQGAGRWGALGCLGLGANQLWLVFGEAPRSLVIGWEAWVVHAALSLLEPGLTLAGPVLRMPDGHGIAILAGCSVTQLLPPALVALAVLRRADARLPLAGPLLALVALLVLANLLRLALLAWSPQAYAWGHGVLGANLFGLLCVGLLHHTAGRPAA